MKLVAFWLAVLGFAVVTAGGCSVSHRSGDFACEKQADCADGRTCTDGFCVGPALDSGVKTDAPPTGSCPSQCTSCNTATKTCTVDCALNPDACTRQITCPTGWSCNIACSGDSACSSGINCANSKGCTIVCSGSRSCQGVTCGAGPCNVDCAGRNSCTGIACGPSCACGVTCSFTSSCLAVTCKALQCTLPTSRGCTLLPATSCNTCK